MHINFSIFKRVPDFSVLVRAALRQRRGFQRDDSAYCNVAIIQHWELLVAATTHTILVHGVLHTLILSEMGRFRA